VQLSQATLRKALDPENFVQTRVTTGSVAPAEVDRMLDVAKAQLSEGRSWVAAESARIAEAVAKLDAAIDSIVSA
jgi:argininosuccinate lyase